MAGYRRLGMDDRVQIHVLTKRGISDAEIARELQVHRSTVGRERRRNRVDGKYYYHLAQQRPQVFHDDLEDASTDPPLSLLVDRRPGRQIVRHKTPLIARLYDIAKAVEHSPQTVLPLRLILSTKRQIRRHKTPFLVAYVTRIPGPLRPHPSILGMKARLEK
jgi:hypothetical protein